MSIFFAWIYGLIANAFQAVPLEYQWLLVPIIPLVREFIAWILVKICFKASGSVEVHTSRLAILHIVLSRHTLFVAIMMGSLTTPTTAYVILGLDFAINIYQALKVVYLIKFSMKENSEHEGMISFDNIVICKVYSLFQKPEIHLLFYFL